MAKTTDPKTDVPSVNQDAQTVPSDGAINVINAINAINAASPADLATPENTPIPGGGSWRWDYSQAGWVQTLQSESLATPFPTLE